MDYQLEVSCTLTPVTSTHEIWHQLVAKHEGQFQQEAPLYNFSLGFFYHSNDDFVINLIDDYAVFSVSNILLAYNYSK